MHRPASPTAPRSTEQGFTLSEFIVVLLVFLGLIAIVVVSLRGIDNESADRDCRSELRAAKAAAERYRAERGDYPSDVAQLREAGFLASGEVTHYAVTVDINGDIVYKAIGSRCA